MYALASIDDLVSSERKSLVPLLIEGSRKLNYLGGFWNLNIYVLEKNRALRLQTESVSKVSETKNCKKERPERRLKDRKSWSMLLKLLCCKTALVYDTGATRPNVSPANI